MCVGVWVGVQCLWCGCQCCVSVYAFVHGASKQLRNAESKDNMSTEKR